MQMLRRTENALATKKQTEKHNKWHSFKNACSSKTLKKIKQQSTGWKTNFFQ